MQLDDNPYSPSSNESSSVSVPTPSHRTYHSYNFFGTEFRLSSRYIPIKAMGKGAYGMVISATDMTNGAKVAVKKLPKIFASPHRALKFLREIRLLIHFVGHENIVSVMDIDPPEDILHFEDLYLVMELLQTDLHRVLRSSFILSPEHIQYFMYQIVLGLYHLHSAGVMHRDLKPSNILLNEDCDLKIADFGLGRAVSSDDEDASEYVVTRYYRPPEILLRDRRYDTSVDIWSVGTIFLEMFAKKPILPGTNSFDQLNRILNLSGTPREEEFTEGSDPEEVQRILSEPFREPLTLSQLLSAEIPAPAEDLASRMLRFNPLERISMAEALEHEYFADIFDPSEISAVKPFNASFDRIPFSHRNYRSLFLESVSHFSGFIKDDLIEILKGDVNTMDLTFNPDIFPGDINLRSSSFDSTTSESSMEVNEEIRF